MNFIEQDGVLPEIPPATPKVEFVWKPNDLYTDLESVMVVARDGDELLWSYEIPPEAGAEMVDIFPDPQGPQPDPSGNEDLVRPRHDEGKKKDKE
jgi:hypothetical protein